ncbi:acyl-CoA dehydrogenase [Gammaproteobacteria bacterium 45_16_T64]|nr:acyl-CoA dehydrogenase [Gammaproteobacteria bacterium 45_16_T64]
MPSYKAPLNDYKFLFDKVFSVYNNYRDISNFNDLSPELTDTILSQAGKFAEQELQPLNYPGHEEGCHWNNGEVITPRGYKAAYEKYIASGWTQISEKPTYGGQGLPRIINAAISEMNLSACTAFGIYVTRDGSIAAIENNASDALKEKYLPKLIDGTWGGPMCMTEPHCGSDLGLIRTKAIPQSDNTYQISGTKMFITGGDSDLGENNINLVLARHPDSPQGIKGISLFIVPKFLVNDDGSLGKRNEVRCGSIEHKMGLNGSATCVMNFDNATGYLVGEINKGMRAMFSMVNKSRFTIGQQGTALAEVAYQNAVIYALERRQMRALTGPQDSDHSADPIIVHPDVRRMLLTQRAFAEGSRALNTYIALLFDKQECSPSEQVRQASTALLDLLTPICKGFNSELCTESVNLGLQTFGGHGFIRENGMEQFVRDARAAQIYEGTTGIQGVDLLGRKILASKGQLLKVFNKEIQQFCEANNNTGALKPFITPLAQLNQEWLDLTLTIGSAAISNPNEVGAASVDYLMYSGYVTFAYCWAMMAKSAHEEIMANGSSPFYESKIRTARFYYQRILPRVSLHAELMVSGCDNLMDTEANDFLLF